MPNTAYGCLLAQQIHIYLDTSLIQPESPRSLVVEIGRLIGPWAVCEVFINDYCNPEAQRSLIIFNNAFGGRLLERAAITSAGLSLSANDLTIVELITIRATGWRPYY